MHDFERGFRIDGVLIDWGTTLAEAAEIVGGPPADARRIGYSTMRLPCPRAYGFDTLAAEMSGYGLARPVTALAYELSPPAGGEAEPEFWTGPINAILGNPIQESLEDIGDRPNPWDAVRYYAHWAGPDFSVGLSVYGALRKIPEGLSAGTLWLSWSTERAVIPYLQEWRAACESLAVAAKGAQSIRTFSVGVDQYALLGDGNEPKGRARTKREANLALTAPDILLTPAPIAERLSPRTFALWSNPEMKIHCLSTRWDSIIWDDGAAPKIDWWHVLPAKGAGQSTIHVGNWWVLDFTDSKSIPAAVEALETIPGVRVNRMEDHDC